MLLHMGNQTWVKNRASKSCLIAAAIATPILFAPAAHADDAAFMKTLERDGLSCGQGLINCFGAADLPTAGKSLCYNIDRNGGNISEAIGKLDIAPAGPGPGAMVTGNPLLEFAVVAMAAYCPRNGDRLGG